MDFDRLAASHKDAVYRNLLRVCRNREDAEDVLIEALLRAYRSQGQLQDAAAFRAWLAQIGRRICWGLKKREALLPVLELSDATQLASREPRPDELAEQQQLKALLNDAIGALPEEYRRVYQLRDIEERSGEETAAELGLTMAGMKSRLHRARQMLRAYLDRVIATDKEETV